MVNQVKSSLHGTAQAVNHFGIWDDVKPSFLKGKKRKSRFLMTKGLK